MKLRLPLATLAALLLLAVPANASSVVATVGGDVTYSGDPANNAVQVSYTGTAYVISDSVAINAVGCLPASGSTTVTCTAAAGGTLTFGLGDGTNSLVLAATVPSSSTIAATGGAGSDSFTNSSAAPGSYTGAAGDDSFEGGSGADTLIGGTGADEMAGNGGVDTVSYADRTTAVRAAIDDTGDSGTACPDAVPPCEGDIIRPSVENLVGGTGNDTLIGSTAANAIDGGDGNDLLDGGVGADTLTGAAGTDTVTYASRTNPVGVALSASGASKGEGCAPAPVVLCEADTFATIENVTGGAGNDVLQGDANPNVLHGGAGRDDLMGRAEADNLFGDAGVDLARYSDRSADLAVSLDDQANDGVQPDGVSTAGEKDNVHSDVEDILGGIGDDVFTGTSAANAFDGNSGNDTVSYAGRSDAVTANLATNQGSDGDTYADVDNLVGGNGNDALTGRSVASGQGGIANALYGNGGNDLLRGGLGNDHLDGGPGVDTVDYSADGRSTGVTASLDFGTASAPSESDTIVDAENLVGTGAADALNGDGGDNTISGLGGGDTLDGEAGDDALAGGDGADSLNGRSGADVLDPGTATGGADGDDTVSGGAGTDTVTYAARTAAQPVTIVLGQAGGGATGSENDTVGADVENAIGGAGNDTIGVRAGDTVANALTGGAGNDTIASGGGGDSLVGGTGQDALDAGEGDDALDSLDGAPDTDVCGPGNDTVRADGPSIDKVNADCENATRAADPGTTPPPAAAPASVLGIANATAREGTGGVTPVVFTIAMAPEQGEAVKVGYETFDDTARAGSDYTAAAGSVTFAPGETQKSVTVLVQGDAAAESTERFGVRLRDVEGNATIGRAEGTGTIVDDDRAAATRVRPASFSARVTPARDRRSPYRFTVRGTVGLPSGVTAATACNGKVSVQTKTVKGATISLRRASLSRGCAYRVHVTLRDRHRLGDGRLKMVVRFAGNAVLRPSAPRTLRVRAG